MIVPAAVGCVSRLADLDELGDRMETEKTSSPTPLPDKKAESGTKMLPCRESEEHNLLQQREVPAVSHVECESEHSMSAAMGRQADSGILVLSPTARALYANGAARQFLKWLNRTENGHPTDGVLPLPIEDLFSEVLKALESRAVNGDRELLQVRRLVGGQDKPVVVRAYGLPDQIGMQRSRIVITMQGISSPAIPGGTDI